MAKNNSAEPQYFSAMKPQGNEMPISTGSNNFLMPKGNEMPISTGDVTPVNPTSSAAFGLSKDKGGSGVSGSFMNFGGLGDFSGLSDFNLDFSGLAGFNFSNPTTPNVSTETPDTATPQTSVGGGMLSGDTTGGGIGLETDYLDALTAGDNIEATNEALALSEQPDYSGLDFSTDISNANFGIDLSGLPQIRQVTASDPNFGDFAEQRQQVTDSLYQQATSRLDPQFEQQAKDLEISLRNRGLSEGDAAFDSAMANFNQGKTDAYQSAMNAAIMGGGQEQSRLFGMDLDKSSNEMARIDQMFGQDSALRNQLMNEMLTSDRAYRDDYNTYFGQEASNADYANALRGLQIDEEMLRRNQPLNELTALLYGQQVGQPNFQGYNTAGAAGGADYLGAANSQYGASLDAFNSQNAMLQGMLQGGAAMYGAGMFG